MSSVVSEGIVLVAVVVAASLLSATFLTGIVDLQSSTMSSTRDIGDTIKTSVKVVHAVNISNTVIKVWVKNIGSVPLYSGHIEKCDVYFGEAGNFQYYSYQAAGVGWRYTLLDQSSDKWNPQDTLEVTLTSGSSFSKGDYFVSFATHNGVNDEEYFSIG